MIRDRFPQGDKNIFPQEGAEGGVLEPVSIRFRLPVIGPARTYETEVAILLSSEQSVILLELRELVRCVPFDFNKNEEWAAIREVTLDFNVWKYGALSLDVRVRRPS